MKKIVFVLFVLLFACSSHKNEVKENASKSTSMKSVSYDSYADLWGKVKDFEKKSLTKTALTFVKDEIYPKAKKENNAPQIVKSLLYIAKYSQRVEEEALLQTVSLFKKEINESDPPLRNILQNYLAQIYWKYYLQNRHRFATNLAPEAFDPETDFRTWDIASLFREINRLFDESLKEEDLLRTLPLNSFKDIIEMKGPVEKYYPSLYDLLLKEALKFYQSEENTLPQPAYKFQINKPVYLSDVQVFADLKIESKDSLSFQMKALKLYQKWIKSHLFDRSKDALATADLQRIVYVYNHAVFNNKDSLYLQVLHNFVDRYRSSDVSAKAYHKLAQYYLHLGGKYIPGKNEKHRYALVKALEYCQKAIEKYPKSEGASYCYTLKNNILSEKVEVKLESLFPEEKPQLLHINFKNARKIKLSVYKIDYLKYWDFIQTHWKKEEVKDFLQKNELVYTYTESLPDTKDYQQHSVEKVLKPLKNGQYVLLIENAGRKPAVFGYVYMQAANVALQKLHTKKNYRFAVVDREKGMRISDYKVEILQRSMHNSYVPFLQVKKEKSGNFVIEPPKKYMPVKIKVTYDDGKVAWFTDNINTSRFYSDPDYAQPKVFLFTDRGIYRPGQIVYFKALALKEKKNRSDLLPGELLTVILKDANYKEVSQQQIRTNDFGTAAGNFVLPEGTLTGNFTLEVRGKNIYGRKSFKVENYKRPKFEVKFLPVKKAYKVNEEIIVKGEAITYSGAYLSDADVTYRVKRIVELPRWWYWYRPFYRGTPQEIAHGKTKIKDDGSFEILFKAIPDESLSPEDHPVFIYEVTAEVTDINGETHTAVSRVKAGYHSLMAKIKMPDVIIKENKGDSIAFEVTNLNGVKIPAKALIQIYKLQAPSRVLRERPWQSPDIQEMSKEDFVHNFPHIPYDDKEGNYLYWPKAKKYFEKEVNTQNQEKVALIPSSNMPQGKYIALIKTKDADGKEIIDKTFFDIISFKETSVPDHSFFMVHTDKKEYTPDENVLCKIASAVPGSYVRLLLEKEKNIVFDKWVKMGGTSKTIKVPVVEKDRGGFVIHYIFYAYNTWRKGQLNIKVPYPSKELKVETLSFRDKLVPGQKETWSFKIKGPKGEKVSAEILASMYDASLDAFVMHKWHFNPIRYVYYTPSYSLSLSGSFDKNSIFLQYYPHENKPEIVIVRPPQLKWFGFRLGRAFRGYLRGNRGIAFSVKEKEVESAMPAKAMASDEMEEVETEEAGIAVFRKIPEISKEKKTEIGIGIRKNLQETAFFYPQIKTDKNGKFQFSFTVPDALTKWKLQLLAHDKKLNYAYKEYFVQTQKDLMIFPNMPRFVREGDKLRASVKITNLTGKKIKGKIKIILNDALSMKNLTDEWVDGKKELDFEVTPKGNSMVSWLLNIKDDAEALQYTFIATAGNQSDGEQNILPVLSNRMLVTETLPMWVRAGEKKTFELTKLKKSHSKSLKNHLLALEVTSNPAWYAIQSLPYLMESKYPNSEQIFSRFYANSLAEHIIKKYPQIRRVFEQWKNTDAMLSALEKNPELKSVVLEATPWVRDAETEAEQKKRIALLFDYNKMAYELSHSLQKLEQMQLPSGGFVWYKGAPKADPYITQYIVNGMGHLKHLGVNISMAENMIKKAVHFTDKETQKSYEELLKQAQLSKNKEKYLKEYIPSSKIIYYLYGRSFYPEIPKTKEVEKIHDYYLNQAQKFWTSYDYYSQGLLALASYRNGDKDLAKEIVIALDENSVDSPELGKYWKSPKNTWRGFHSGIEQQALFIEAFQEIGMETSKIDEMRIWLLKHKQTNAWKNSKQTAEAIYALLNSGTNWLPIKNNVKIVIGNKNLDPAKMPDVKVEAGTGYFKKTWRQNEIKPEMARVTMINTGKGIVWGALYWQYFEDLNKIDKAKTNLAIEKKLYIRKFTDRGEELEEISKDHPVQIGDLVRVRIIIKVDRDMEYVDLKDMRAAGLEPVNVLSGYKWKNGLGYYESITDVSTHFFINKLPKGIYVFEYDLRANNSGIFSAGIASIQSMYAPEFSSHSQGLMLEIKD